MRICVLVAALTVLSGGTSQLAAAKPATPPNVVLIFSDDQGMGDVSCYGSEISTPHIDSIARAGVTFDNWYVAAPVCTPSRFSLMTGRYPNRSHDKLLGALMFLESRDDHRGIRADETTIAEVLSKNGYRTGLIGKWHLGHGESHFLPTRHGFDVFYGCAGGCIDYFTLKYGFKPDWYRQESQIEETGYSTDLITREAVRFLDGQQPDHPFFLYLSYTAPHYGKGWDEQRKKTTNILQPKKEDLQRFTHIKDARRRSYAAMVAAMDDGIGRVLETIDKRGLADNTLVIFMTDNGGDPRYGGSNQPFRGGKATLYEGGIRVPCLMRWPGRIEPGTTSDQVGSALDLFPTICRLAGIDANSFQPDGIDLTPFLTRGDRIDRTLFFQVGARHAFRDGRWKYVRQEPGVDALFDLGVDPYEASDVAGDHPEIVDRLNSQHAAISATFARKQ